MLDETELLSVFGTVVVVGPSESDGRDRTYQHLVICEKSGQLCRLTVVRAVPQIAALIEPNAIGIFLFWQLPGERRLLCVDRADGRKHVDFEAMRSYILKEE